MPTTGSGSTYKTGLENLSIYKKTWSIPSPGPQLSANNVGITQPLSYIYTPHICHFTGPSTVFMYMNVYEIINLHLKCVTDQKIFSLSIYVQPILCE